MNEHLSEIALKKDLDILNDSINNIETDIFNLETSSSTLVSNVSNLENNLSTLNTKVQKNINDISSLSTEVADTKKSVSDGKKLVADAITAKGQTTATNATFQTMATNISKIQTGIDTSDGTATAAQILKDKIAYVNGNRIVGTMANKGAVTGTLSTNGQSYTIPAGYHSGSGKVTASITNLAAGNIKSGVTVGGVAGTFTSDSNATAAQILANQTAYVKGAKVTGTMVNRGTVNQSLAINGSYTIPAGYHSGSGKVTQSITTKSAATYTPGTSNQTISSGQYLSGAQTIKGDSNLKASNIRKGISIFGVNGSLDPGYSYIDIGYLGNTSWHYELDTNYVNATSYTLNVTRGTRIIRYNMYANAIINNSSGTYLMCAAAPTMACYWEKRPYVCGNIYEENFGTKQYSAENSPHKDLWAPNVTLSLDGKTLRWTWVKGKSQDITAIFLSLDVI